VDAAAPWHPWTVLWLPLTAVTIMAWLVLALVVGARRAARTASTDATVEASAVPPWPAPRPRRGADSVTGAGPRPGTGTGTGTGTPVEPGIPTDDGPLTVGTSAEDLAAEVARWLDGR
jgi:hypothetical protein